MSRRQINVFHSFIFLSVSLNRPLLNLWLKSINEILHINTHFDSYSMPSIFSVNHKMQFFSFNFYTLYLHVWYMYMCALACHMYMGAQCMLHGGQNQKIMLPNFLCLVFRDKISCWISRICLSLPLLYLNYIGILYISFICGSLKFKLRPSCLHSKLLTNANISVAPQNITFKK